MPSVRFERMDRDTLLTKWNDPGFRGDVLDMSDDRSDEAFGVSDILENHSPASPTSPSSAVDYLLYNKGFNLYDNGFQVSARMKNFGPWNQREFNKRDPENSNLVLVDAHLDSSYWRTLITGQRTKDIGVLESIYKNLNQIGGIMQGNVLNPIRETPFIRAKLFGAAIDFRRIVGDIEFITEESYKLNKDNNVEDERKMETYPEGVVPKIMTLEYSDESLTFTKFRGGVRATYDYLNSNQTRVARIRNAIEEIAIYHRIALFEMVVKAIKAGRVRAGSNNLIDKSELNWTIWRDFIKGFGSFYSPDIMLCRTAESTVWEGMQVPTSQGTIPVGQLAATTGFGQSPYVLNNVPMVPEYGWYDDLPNTEEGLETGKYLVFDRDRSSIIIFQRGSDQDETEREAGPQIVTRYLSTKAGAYCPDVNGVKELDANA